MMASGGGCGGSGHGCLGIGRTSEELMKVCCKSGGIERGRGCLRARSSDGSCGRWGGLGNCDGDLTGTKGLNNGRGGGGRMSSAPVLCGDPGSFFFSEVIFGNHSGAPSNLLSMIWARDVIA